MMRDYYDDGNETGPASDTREEREERHDSQKTTIIPSGLCPDLDVGDMVAFKVVAVHESEYEVEYAHREPNEESEEEEAEEHDGGEEPSMERASAANEGASAGSGRNSYLED